MGRPAGHNGGIVPVGFCRDRGSPDRSPGRVCRPRREAPTVDLPQPSCHPSTMNLGMMLSCPPGKTLSGVNRRGLVVALVLMTFSRLAAEADWPEFRGPRGDGHVSAPGAGNLIGLPLNWSETNNIKWKTAIPHRGWSTPVVMGGQVWLTTATEDGHDYFAISVD